MIEFEWDPLKNILNLGKHGVSFEEAQTVFLDDSAILYEDVEHSETEERYILLGLSQMASVMVVVHCYRKEDTVIRIISARKATKSEAEVYLKQK